MRIVKTQKLKLVDSKICRNLSSAWMSAESTLCAHRKCSTEGQTIVANEVCLSIKFFKPVALTMDGKPALVTETEQIVVFIVSVTAHQTALIVFSESRIDKSRYSIDFLYTIFGWS